MMPIAVNGSNTKTLYCVSLIVDGFRSFIAYETRQEAIEKAASAAKSQDAKVMVYVYGIGWERIEKVVE